MDIARTESVSVWRYVGYYILTMIALTIAFAILSVFVPSFSDNFAKAVGVGINIASTMVAYSIFVRHNVRLFNRDEYWRIVSFSTLAACLFSAVQGWLAFVAGAVTEDLSGIPAAVWVGILLFAGLLVFALNAGGYSNRFGNTMLKAELARRARIDTETFR